MARRPFRLGRSLTGLGLFATRPIKKNLRVAEYKGQILGIKAAEEEERKGNRYLYEINSRWTIDGKSRGNIARYFNHSCNPNTESYTVGHRVFVRTLRNIKPDEELTYDYGIDYLKNVIGKSNCKCARCRRRRAKRARELRALKVRRDKRLATQRKKARAAKTSTSSTAKTRGRAKR
jgi:SET domain-containing protein